jgi:magnesium-transporting ATPase (P-type)
MARRRAIVKNLSSVETLGACTVICTDKTGTLTRNEMTARGLWLSEGEVAVTGSGYERSGAFLTGGAPLADAELESVRTLLRVGQLCSTARLRPSDTANGDWHVAGDPTEVALLVAAAKAGLDRGEELARYPLIRNLAFDNRRKRMSTVHRAPPGKQGLIVFAKGAPLELLEHCTEVLVDGKEAPLTSALLEAVTSANDRMAQNGQRVLGMAYRFLPGAADAQIVALAPGEVEQALVFVGLVGLQDPPRTAVPAAVAQCRAAGVRIIMITGDYGLTGEAIARQVGMIGDGALRVIEGDELERLSRVELQQALRSGAVLFARTTPEHKLRIVTELQSLGEVVAVTGDGVNDAPALKHADIGVAMGRSGTDVAREAADMVLQDDNFATIVAAIEEGRAIFDNMRKFIVYIFAHLSPEALPFIFFALFHTPLPLTVMQILAIDLGTETLPALALGVERPEPDVMQRPPRSRNARLLDAASLARGYAFLGLLTSAVVLAAFFLFLQSEGWLWGESQAPTSAIGDQATTVVFLGIVLMQVGNAFACRTERASAFSIGLLSNRFLLWGIAFELVFAAVIIYTPLLQPIFGTGPLDARWWLFLLAFVPVIFGLEEGRKAIVRRRRRL